MPGLNQTGPTGQGPMTGRRMGRCANHSENKNHPVDSEKETTGHTASENLPESEKGVGRGKGLGHGRGQGGRGMGKQNRFRGGL